MYYWLLLEIVFICIFIYLIKKYKISGQRTAVFAFILLFITMLLNIFRMDLAAGKVAEFVWILLTISFIQEFYHFLKHENK